MRGGRCLSRDHFMTWSDGAGSIEKAMAQVVLTLGVDADERIENVERDIVDGPNLPRSEWQGRGPPHSTAAARRTSVRPNASGPQGY